MAAHTQASAEAFPCPITHAGVILDACEGDWLEAHEILQLNIAHGDPEQAAYWNRVAESLVEMEPELPMAFCDGEGGILRQTNVRESEAKLANALLLASGSDRRWMLYAPEGAEA